MLSSVWSDVLLLRLSVKYEPDENQERIENRIEFVLNVEGILPRLKKLFLYLIIGQLATINILEGGLLGELCRIPQLVKHYDEHRAQSPEISLSQFLALHYFNTEHRTNDQEHHTRLPFAHYPSHATLLVVPYAMHYLPVSYTVESRELFIAVNERFDSFSIFRSVFHPPDRG